MPSKVITKLRTLCNWLLNFLMGHPKVVRVGNNTGAPPGCVLNPLLYSLFTHDCMAWHDSNTVTKFTNNTTVVCLITDNNEPIGRRSDTWQCGARTTSPST